MKQINLSDIIALTIIVMMVMTPYCLFLIYVVMKWGERQKENEDKYKAMYEMITKEIKEWPNVDSCNETICDHIEELYSLKHKNREMTDVLEAEFSRKIYGKEEYDRILSEVEEQLTKS